MVYFLKIASGYEAKSLEQVTTGQALLNLPDIKENNDDVLDLGCCVGNFTIYLVAV